MIEGAGLSFHDSLGLFFFSLVYDFLSFPPLPSFSFPLLLLLSPSSSSSVPESGVCTPQDIVLSCPFVIFLHPIRPPSIALALSYCCRSFFFLQCQAKHTTEEDLLFPENTKTTTSLIIPFLLSLSTSYSTFSTLLARLLTCFFHLLSSLQRRTHKIFSSFLLPQYSFFLSLFPNIETVFLSLSLAEKLSFF